MKWEELTSKDIEELDKDKTVVILPIGSIEVHGPHLPLGTDTITIYYVVLKATEIEDALVLPPLYYAYVPENRNFKGTISLKSDTFLKLLEDILDEVARQGFKKFLIVNGHGGNRRPLALFLRKMLEKNKR
ncbi:MAG TPA: creatininase family protein, partial [Thermoprotei archaeon]|nr:creatininase family protein [Thermoprotei archaeon]